MPGKAEKKAHEFDFEIVNDRIAPIADALIKKYSELGHLEARKILFIANHKSSGSKKQISLARTSRISPKWQELLFQIANASYFHVIEFYVKTTECLDSNQMTALVYRELRRIGPEGQIVPPDVHDWWQILRGLGRYWFYPDQTCPNLLDDSVDWKRLMGSEYEEPRVAD